MILPRNVSNFKSTEGKVKPNDVTRRFFSRIWFAGSDYPVSVAFWSRFGKKITSNHPVQLPVVSANFPYPDFY